MKFISLSVFVVAALLWLSGCESAPPVVLDVHYQIFEVPGDLMDATVPLENRAICEDSKITKPVAPPEMLSKSYVALVSPQEADRLFQGGMKLDTGILLDRSMIASSANSIDNDDPRQFFMQIHDDYSTFDFSNSAHAKRPWASGRVGAFSGFLIVRDNKGQTEINIDMFPGESVPRKVGAGASVTTHLYYDGVIPGQPIVFITPFQTPDDGQKRALVFVVVVRPVAPPVKAPM